MLFLLFLLIASHIPLVITLPPRFRDFTPPEEIRMEEALKTLGVYSIKTMHFIKTQHLELVMGITYSNYWRCYIELDPRAFHEKVFKPVFYHEIGHCFGLDHSENFKDIMYKEVMDEKDYNAADWERFFVALKKQL
jgi:predicted Zn-dependent protease